MPTSRFQRAEELFHEALALAPAQREQHVRAAAADDGELALQVQRMIRFAERTSGTAGLMNANGAAATSDAPADRLTGVTIGPYRVIDLLGEGGFGAVYRAQQESPVRRMVALKILTGGMDSRQVVARFEAERHALALMEHPNIARVFDAGQTSADLPCGSRPFFVMELVDGQPITRYCDEHRLDSKARLELFCAVCHAVQHAHHKGIIHRDLKPSNILISEIDGVPTPKVIDFGIAKVLHQSLTERPFVTQRLELLGTPQYMSPEQAAPQGGPESLDTRSDVYSLGVVLYELLTGSTPLDALTLAGVSYSRMQQMICEGAVERPSTRLLRLGEAAREVALRQSTDAASLRRRLRGDLDWIALKALDPDRERRYSSPSALADDIRRHLHYRPVLAGPPGVAYRMRKFARRHRVAVGAAALVGLTLIVGAVVVTLATLRVRESAEQALQINSFMRDVLVSPSPDRSGAQVPLAGVLQTASATASQRFADHPEIEAQVRDLLGQVYLNLDMRRECIAEFQQAAALLHSIHGPDDRRTLVEQLRHVQALTHAELGREAEQVLAEIVPRIRRVAGPNDPLALEADMFVASADRFRGRYEEAERGFRALRQRAADIGGDDLMHYRIVDGLIVTLRTQLGSDLERNRQIRSEIEALAQEMVERSERQFGPESIPLVRARVIVADMMLERGEAAGAAEICRAVLKLSEERLGSCHGQRVIAESVLAQAVNQLGDSATAADQYLRIIECVRTQSASTVDMLSWIGSALPYLDQGGRWAEGEALAREFSAALRAIGGGHDDMLFNGDVYIARFVSLRGRHDEAEALFQALLPREREADDPQSRARLYLFYGSDLIRRGQYEQAEQRLRAAEDRLDDIRRGTDLSQPDDLIAEFIALYQAWGKPQKVQEYQALREQALAEIASPG
jgi:eukaryotic-like serine/threonine-protein kinase